MSRQKYIPEKFQKQLIDKCVENKRYGIFSFPGSGKTAISLNITKTLREYTLVIVPNNIEHIWIDELKKWDFAEDITYNVISSSNRKIEKKHITIVTNTMLKYFLENRHKVRWKFGIMIVDESADFKNPKSLKFKALKSISANIKRRYILSGNPIRNGYLDLWTQFYLLDSGLRLESSFYKYRDKHFYPIDYMRFSWRLLEGRERYIIDRIKDICLFIDKDESKLPKRNEIDLYYDSDNDTQIIYADASKKLLFEIDGNKKEIASRQVSLFKCDQIASGFVYYENDQFVRQTKILHSNLTDKCYEEIVKQNGSPVIVTYRYLAVCESIIEKLKQNNIEFFLVTGDNKAEAQSRWNKNEIKVMISNIESIARGFNLQFSDGNTIIVMNMVYNYDTYDQLIMRLQRRGSKHKQIDVIRIGSKFPIHKAIFESIKRKNAEFNRFITYLKEFIIEF